MISTLELTILDTLGVVESVDLAGLALGVVAVDVDPVVDLAVGREASVGTAVAFVLKIVAFEVVENFVNWVGVEDFEEVHSIFFWSFQTILIRVMVRDEDVRGFQFLRILRILRAARTSTSRGGLCQTVWSSSRNDLGKN